MNRRMRNRTSGGVGGRRGQPRLLPDPVTRKGRNAFLLLLLLCHSKIGLFRIIHLKRIYLWLVA